MRGTPAIGRIAGAGGVEFYTPLCTLVYELRADPIALDRTRHGDASVRCDLCH